jgi:SAM-dependent methyltransferase
MMQHDPILTERQKREVEYHRQHASRRRQANYRPVAVDIISEGPRRPWNPFWSMWDRVLAADVAGKRILVPGCGFGEDAVRLALLGAEVYAFDLSPEAVDIARTRAYRARCCIDVRVMAAETIDFPTAFFDGAVLVDILHHVDIAAAMAGIARVVARGGLIIGNELYTHSATQRIRDSALVSKYAYPLMRQWIYGGGTPYITADEHKIDERELATVLGVMEAPSVDYFGMMEGRLFPTRMTWPTRLDKMIMTAAGGLAEKLAGRVVFSGGIA